MSRDFYRDHGGLSPDCFDDSEYLNWAQDNGLYVDVAGNVDYGPPAFDRYEGGTTVEMSGRITEGGWDVENGRQLSDGEW